MEIGPLRRMPAAVARRFLRYALRAAVEGCAGPSVEEQAGWHLRGLAGSSADFSQIERLLALAFSGESGSSLALPRGVIARKEFSTLLLETPDSLPALSPNFLYPVSVPGAIPVPEIGSSITFELIPLAAGQARYNGEEDLLDRRVSDGPLILRNWRPGDAYQPRGRRTSRKLKELFQRRRVSHSERRSWPVVVAGDRVVWSRGWGVAEGFGPGPESNEALRIRESKW